jgi:hypothetical protein
VKVRGWSPDRLRDKLIQWISMNVLSASVSGNNIANTLDEFTIYVTRE